jgi:hypothetical protein
MTLTPTEPDLRFEERLRGELRELYFERYPESEASPRSVRPRSTARWASGIVTAAAIMVVVALIATGTFRGPGRGGRIVGRTGSGRIAIKPTTRVPSKAVLVTKVSQAVANVAGDIFHVHTVNANGGTIDDWLTGDGSTFRSTSSMNGVEQSDLMQQTSGGTVLTTVVDYSDHAWWTYGQPTEPTSSTSPTGGNSMPLPDINGVPGTAAGVKWLLSSGRFTVVAGTQVVDGITTYEMSRSIEGRSFSLWINQSTDLPVQVEMNDPGNPSGSYTSTATWIEPTQSNLAGLKVPIPGGFTHAAAPISPAAPAGDGVG